LPARQSWNIQEPVKATRAVASRRKKREKAGACSFAPSLGVKRNGGGPICGISGASTSFP